MITKPTKYTQKFVLKELKWMLKTVLGDTDILFKQELFIPKKYSSNRLWEWKAKFSQDDEISGIIKRIDDILMVRIAKWWMKNKYNAMIAKLCLSANYWMNEKSHVEQTNVNIDLKDLKWMTPKQLEEERKKLLK